MPAPVVIAATASASHGGPDAVPVQQELEHQRQLMELMQQMQQQMRQMQYQEQQAHEAQTQQGAPPSGGSGVTAADS